VAVGTSDGQHYEDEFEYQHKQIFPEQQEQQLQGDNKMFLVRHGDTALNDADLIHGWVDAPLNEKGIQDAHKAADSLDGKNITRIVSSDLPRAKQTANIISKKLGIPVTFDPNLRTWDSGDFDYTDKHDEFKKYTQQTGGTSLNDLLKMEAPDVKDNPESIPGLVDKHGEIVVSPTYEYYDKQSDSNKHNTKVKDWLDKGNLPNDIDREDFGTPGKANHLIILRKKNLKALVG
jgi:bisphosphoglycerate-dependent phosphoglycerate mutase